MATVVNIEPIQPLQQQDSNADSSFARDPSSSAGDGLSTPTTPPPPAPYAIDKYGFYISQDDQQLAPVELDDRDVETQRQEEQWWMTQIRNYRCVRGNPHRHASRRGSTTSPGHADQKNGTGATDKGATPSPRQEHHECLTSRANGPYSPGSPNALQRAILKDIRYRIRKGIRLPIVRRVVWPFLTGSLDAPQGRYRELCAGPIPFESNEVILRDLPRTFPTHCLYVGFDSVGQSALHRVLTAYCNLDPEVGYCQGMGFVVSVLLLHMPEEGAFWTFAQMMRGKQFDMRRLFLPGFPLLQQFFVILRRILRDMLPVLANHLEDQNVDVSFFASQWFLTLFAYQFPVPVLCRLWDLFFSEGWKFMFRVTVALLQWDMHKLVQMRMEDILMFLKTIHEGKDVAEIVERSLEVPINESDLQVDITSF